MLDFLKRLAGELIILFLAVNVAYIFLLTLSGFSFLGRATLVGLVLIAISLAIWRVKS